MTLPASGTISMSNINTEMGRASNYQFSLNDSDVRALAGVPSGTISLSNFYGKSNIHYVRPSTYSITSVTGGSVTNPTAIYAGKTGPLNTSAYTTVAHGALGLVDQQEGITYSGFGSGTVTGSLWISASGSLSDAGLGAQSNIQINGGTVYTSPDSFSWTTNVYTGSINLSTLSVYSYATGGHNGPLEDGDTCTSTFDLKDILVIY